MEIASVSWSNRGEDVHLMRGKSPLLKLLDRIWVAWQATPTSPLQSQRLEDFLSSHPNAGCTFRPTFKGPLDPATNEYRGFGVRVNARTGEVNTEPNPPGPLLHNFTILARVVADKNDPASSRKNAYLRIHLHKHVAKAWLSPSRLRVPKNVQAFKFSVYAQFDDKVIAALDTNLDVLFWASDPPGKVNLALGFITFNNSDVDDSEVKIKASLTAEFRDSGGGIVTAEGIAIPYTLPRIAHLIPNSAGYDRRNEVPNFLFLADGFLKEDEGKFNTMIDGFLNSLRREAKFQPFDRLVGGMNFWKVFVPSAVRGIGTKYEVYGDEHSLPMRVAPEEFDLKNDVPASESDLIEGRWGANQVRFYFGLPMLEHKEMSNSDVQTYWKQISRLPAGLIDEVSGGLIEEWKKMGDRRVVNESDTFLGTRFGLPTKVKELPFEDPNLFTLNFYDRFNRYRINPFLIDLQYQDENGTLHPIGPVWNSDIPTTGGSEPIGKDYDNVIILLCANFGRAQNEWGFLNTNVVADERGYIGIEPDGSINSGFPEGRAARVVSFGNDRLSADMPLIPGKTTLLHEIGHSLGLGDEYGESGITKQSVFLKFTGTGSMEMDKSFSNLQAKSDLILAPPFENILPEKIKWRWHRIEKSGVLAPLSASGPAAITTNGAQYTIKLKPGQAAAFAEFDNVFLRRRRPREFILRDVEYSQISPRYPFVTRSPELAVISVHATADQVVVQPVRPAELIGHNLIDDFPAECVLYKPLLSRTEDPTDIGYPFLELVAANVMDFMASTNLPLHEKKDVNGNPEPDFEAEQSPVLVDIGNPLCAKKNRNIVGLYAGGKQYHHGVYHPTGHCMMRADRLAEFCSVCKYIITDYIDPSLHSEVDKLIEKYYPLKDQPPNPSPPF
jgi:hypothetical protein